MVYRSNSRRLMITVFVIVAIALFVYFPQNVPKVRGAQRLLDCDSFYASDLVGCGEQKTPLKSYPSQEKLGSVADLKSFSKVAVVIDDRIQHNPKFFPVLAHVSGVLGPSWPIHVYTNPLGIDAFSTSASMKQAVDSGQISLFTLPSGVAFPNADAYSAFMTSRWIWDAVAPAEHILIFQADSILCANAPKSVDDFLEWDFIGAPIDPAYGHGYNGGLSLRRRSSTLRILERFIWEESRGVFEDQWYYERLLELQEDDSKAGREATIQLPPKDVAMTFAVETINYPYPVGLHQPRRYGKNEDVSLDEYCPEYKLCIKYGDK